MGKIIYISDFDLGGSGYCNIAINLCQQLVSRGYDVLAIGLGYKRQEHNYPFTIIPTDWFTHIPQMLANLVAQGVEIDTIIVALDINLQEGLLEKLNAPGDIPYIGIFPLEAGPLCNPWALSLLRMNERLVMSRFAVEELAAKGVTSEFIPIGVDTESWRCPTPDERQKIRQGLGVDEDTFVVLTVADNQERKNLSRSLEIFAGFAEKRDALYWLVTRPDSSVGWKLDDYAFELGIMDKVQIYKRGMPFNNLWALYAAADAMLLTSKAEGLAMPVLEAMSCRLPVIGTRCAAIEEHLSGGRGLLIEPDYVHIDPWGNSRRYLAGLDDGVYQLRLWVSGMTVEDNARMLDAAQAYVRARTWAGAGDVLEQTVKRVTNGKTEKQSETEYLPA